MKRRRLMVCRHCGRICYRVRLADGSVAWVSHLHLPQSKPGTITCPASDRSA